MDEHAVVLAGLRRLRKGNGVCADDLDARVRPEFRTLFGARSDTGENLRRKLVTYLEELLVGLPEQLKQVARISLNLPPSIGGNLESRLDRLATEKLYCNVRTVRRRMEEAYVGMARNACAGSGAISGGGHGGSGWYVDVFDVVLRLDVDTPEAIERRTIIVTADSLDSVTTSIDVPSGVGSGQVAAGLHREMVSGGLVTGVDRGSSTNFSTSITLSRSLKKGERHTLEMIFRIPAGQAMAPWYVYVPYRHCRYFRLLVRFDSNKLPRAVWERRGDVYSAVRDGVPTEWTCELNRAFEVEAEFQDLVPGCAYGIQWAW